jgi:hypothetical protein
LAKISRRERKLPVYPKDTFIVQNAEIVAETTRAAFAALAEYRVRTCFQ